MQNMIPTLMRRLGLKGTLYGFRYLDCGLRLVLQDETYLLDLTHRLYPDIAGTFNVKPSNVERCLRTLVDSFWDHGNKALLEKITGHPIKHKPYVGEFIDILYGYLCAANARAK